MGEVFTLTPQPIRVTAAQRQPMYLAVDISGFDGLDVEAVVAVEGTAAGAALNLFTGMQTDTDDGWIVPSTNFGALSGTGQQVTRVSVSSGLLKYLRWDVSSLGGASALTFFVRGVGRVGLAGAGAAVDPMKLGFSTVSYCVANGASTQASSTSVGAAVWLLQPVTITGIRFYWQSVGSAKTVKVNLYDPSNAIVATANVAVNASGAYSASFAPVAVGASALYKTFTLSMWETTGGSYTYIPTNASHPTNVVNNASLIVTPYLMWVDNALYHAGDARPDTSIFGSNQYYPIEPILTAA